MGEDGEGSTFDKSSSSTIKLNNGTVLYLREVNKFLAVVCILREDSFDKQGLIDYNFQCFKQAIQEVFDCTNKKRQKQIMNTMNNQQTILYNNSNGSHPNNGYANQIH